MTCQLQLFNCNSVLFNIRDFNYNKATEIYMDEDRDIKGGNTVLIE